MKAKENKKIRNATPNEYAGIHFKSFLEKSVYRHLLTYGVTPIYEGKTYCIEEGFVPTVPFYDIRKVRGKNIRKNHLNMVAVSPMFYTPDFVFDYNGIEVIIEAKGQENDQFPIRKKLFRKYLETVDYPVIFAEIFTIGQLHDFMNALETTQNDIKNVKTIRT